MSNKEKIGKSLYLFRIKLGLKQEWLADKLGISQSQLCKIEMGKKELSMSSFYLFAALLRISPSVHMEFILIGIEQDEKSLFRILLRELNNGDLNKINLDQIKEINEKIINYYEANEEAAKKEISKLFKTLGWKIEDLEKH